MQLNGTIDAAVQGGLKKYKEVRSERKLCEGHTRKAQIVSGILFSDRVIQAHINGVLCNTKLTRICLQAFFCEEFLQSHPYHQPHVAQLKATFI